MNLMDMIREEQLNEKAPLAERQKPKRLEDFVGQEDILSEGKLLRRLIEADRLTSLILHGPTGVGKTSLARIISELTSSAFVNLNAVTSGIKDIKEVVAQAKQNLEMGGRRTILFIDEIHRFNKAQQDALLPHVEQGTLILIGATTENPYFEVNRALLSRSLVFELQPLREEDILVLIERALKEDSLLRSQDIEISEAGKQYIAKQSFGDARRALNILELAILTSNKKDGTISITEDILAQCIQKPFFNYDKQGDFHYDVISAFIKSVRGSDPQAALYYLAQMLQSGEDPKFIARRLLILSAEDIGLADPQALVIANAGFDALHKLGMPEARIILSEVTLYLSMTDKSNSAYLAIDQALAALSKGQGSVPQALRDGTNKNLRGLRQEYLYPHDYPGAFVEQEYLPDALRGSKFYQAKQEGEEKQLQLRWINRRKRNK